MPRNTILIVRGDDRINPKPCSVMIMGAWERPAGIDESESAIIRMVGSIRLGRMRIHDQLKDSLVLSVAQDSIVGTVKSPFGTMTIFDSLPSTRTAFCTASEAV